MSSVYAKLLSVQRELKAPKSQWNEFSKFYYRKAEDIMEALKPICEKYQCVTFISDSLEYSGERLHIKSTAVFVDVETGERLECSAVARESLARKGMDDSQISGATSSYARKYALGALFLLDDSADIDSLEDGDKVDEKASKKRKKGNAPEKSIDEMKVEANDLLKAAKSREDVVAIYESYPQLRNQKFNEALNKRIQEIES